MATLAALAYSACSCRMAGKLASLTLWPLRCVALHIIPATLLLVQPACPDSPAADPIVGCCMGMIGSQDVSSLWLLKLRLSSELHMRDKITQGHDLVHIGFWETLGKVC